MKVWDSFLPKGYGEFLTERGVDMPRAWALHCRQDNLTRDYHKRTFEAFLKAEYPVQHTAWRIITGGL